MSSGQQDMAFYEGHKTNYFDQILQKRVRDIKTTF